MDLSGFPSPGLETEEIKAYILHSVDIHGLGINLVKIMHATRNQGKKHSLHNYLNCRLAQLVTIVTLDRDIYIHEVGLIQGIFFFITHLFYTMFYKDLYSFNFK